MLHDIFSPSDWVRRWAGAIIPASCVLDVACGSGRHTRHLLERGFKVTAVDLAIDGVKDLQGEANCQVVQADLENAPWPFNHEGFDGVVVTNYLFRPHLAQLIASLKPGGVLIYETFSQGNAEFGRPSNPDFLLKPGELLAMTVDSTRVIAFEDVYVERPKPAVMQRICAVKNGAPPRHFPVPGN